MCWASMEFCYMFNSVIYILCCVLARRQIFLPYAEECLLLKVHIADESVALEWRMKTLRFETV
jgi:hypothetical protein